ncbi:carbohydrate esterase family 4 protein [Coniophora puteana RWD-64-598 SS2]|uniref:chitin deacetylase n=1 Tax=Coniophora puteana (strain RWD-64-598) TaxID=741705 RepID=A0A5M3MAL3_CONPW|nr:carbohydrate esterase family 4 protein [Coniophora puteana RWD-64-598 SS2]EIW76113.1 carbohydrate esterase family 4 protein [Coniophora puteana RWD-64-598 SS2]
MPSRLASSVLLAVVTLATASHSAKIANDYDQPSSAWYQPDDHPVHALFKRGHVAVDATMSYPEVGSAQWRAGYPAAEAPTETLPKAWVDRLNAAVTAGKIPNIPQSILTQGVAPTYPEGYDPNNSTVCSSTYKCITPGDIWDAPTGKLALSFDDGPLPASTALLQFLAKNKQKATHFFIGTNILNNPQVFKTAFNDNKDDIAVHTWTHPYMTSKSNEQVLGELGWTMEIIHNSTGGRIPKYWRPPYGDSDMRVRAIAKEVFGLTTVIWNQDTNDWSLSEPVPLTTSTEIHANMTQWLTGPKTPGLVILEHELSNASVQSFIDAYPMMTSNKWNVVSLAALDGGASYQNAYDSSAPVAAANVGDLNVKAPAAPASSSTTQASKPSGTTAGKPKAAQRNGGSYNEPVTFVSVGVTLFSVLLGIYSL